MIKFVFQSVFRRLKRYGFLVGMIAFGIMAVTLIQSMTEGMKQNVIEGAARYVGGRYVVLERTNGVGAQTYIDDSDKILAAIGRAGIRPTTIVKREVVLNENAPILVYNGESFKMRKVYGLDPRNEAGVLSQLDFLSGSFTELAGTNGILISKQAADRLGLRVGDELVLQLFNRDGYLDSASLVVQGIFRDASLFGYYNAYMDFDALRKLIGDPEGVCRAMGFYFPGNENPAEQGEMLRKALAASGFELMPVRNRTDLENAAGMGWSGARHTILPVEDYIDGKVMDLINAIQMLAYVSLVLILVIILVGMRNTTQIMTRRRFKEIGTLRALGLTRGKAQGLILAEALIIASLGFMLGVAGAIAILEILGVFNLGWMEGFDIFMKHGHLTWKLSATFLAVNYGALALMTIIGAMPAARRAASISPVAAIATND
jgi:ABC-type lipoprotein release transport system permease subunit